MCPPICVVLDTSVLYNDYKLEKAPLRELLNVAKLCNAQVLLPKVVFDEHVSHFERDCNNWVNQINSAIRKLRQYRS